MNKLQKRETAKIEAMIRAGTVDAGYAARSISALVRAAMTRKARNELITFAAGWPAVVQHSDFIV